ncbi:hypothetical protein [Streptomyces antibioticus]|uniref:hypothetical protein n=1 Tax=Streptomyces antibioticus TaxID=1890 RepID=UPI0036BF6F6F
MIVVLIGGVNWWVGRDTIVITFPKEGSEVPRCLPTFGGTGKLASGHHLWIAVQFSDPSGESRFLFSRRAVMNNGKWHANKIDVGGEKQALSTYTIIAVDVDQATDDMLKSTLVDMSFSGAETEKKGQDLWRISYQEYPSGAHPVADVTVTRAQDQQDSCNELTDKARRKQ